MQIKINQYLIGSVLLVIALLSAFAYKFDFTSPSVFYGLNVFIVLFWAAYYLFKKKKDVLITEDKLIVRKGSEKLQEYNLIDKLRVVKGITSVVIIFKNFSVKFFYSEFNKDSKRKLKSLT